MQGFSVTPSDLHPAIRALLGQKRSSDETGHIHISGFPVQKSGIPLSVAQSKSLSTKEITEYTGRKIVQNSKQLYASTNQTTSARNQKS